MKKLVCLLVCLVAGVFAPVAAHSQVSFYGDFSASKLTYQANTNVLYGPTVGAFIGLKNLGHVNFSGDIRGSFVGVSGVRLDGLVVGPRIATSVKFLKLKPYAEFMVGFARYNNAKTPSPVPQPTPKSRSTAASIAPLQNSSTGASSNTATPSITGSAESTTQRPSAPASSSICHS